MKIVVKAEVMNDTGAVPEMASPKVLLLLLLLLTPPVGV
jgi:hypothetical protein